MACEEHKVSKILPYFGLFLMAISLCHCRTLSRLKAVTSLKQTSTLNQSNHNSSYGKLLIGLNAEQDANLNPDQITRLMEGDVGYQADMVWKVPGAPEGTDDALPKPDNLVIEQLLKLEPKVECTVDSMQLQVQGGVSSPGSLFLVDRGSRLSPVPLSQLPESCGYTVMGNRRGMAFTAPYDGCFVVLEEDNYVLPLRWSGLPLRMSCPYRQFLPSPPMVTCHAEGMVVRTEWSTPVSEIEINLNGNWESLSTASPRCRISAVAHPEGLVITLHYPSCVEKTNGMYTIELAGDVKTVISCPSLYPMQTEQAKLVQMGHQQTVTSGKWDYLSKLSLPTPAPKYLTHPSPKNPNIGNLTPNQGSKEPQPELHYVTYPNYFQPANPPFQATITSGTGKNGQQRIHSITSLKQQMYNPFALPITPSQQQELPGGNSQGTTVPKGQSNPFYPFYLMPDPTPSASNVGKNAESSQSTQKANLEWWQYAFTSHPSVTKQQAIEPTSGAPDYLQSHEHQQKTPHLFYAVQRPVTVQPQKPTEVPQPAKHVTFQSQVYPLVYPFSPVPIQPPEQSPKPTIAPQPEDSKFQMFKPILIHQARPVHGPTNEAAPDLCPHCQVQQQVHHKLPVNIPLTTPSSAESQHKIFVAHQQAKVSGDQSHVKYPTEPQAQGKYLPDGSPQKWQVLYPDQPFYFTVPTALMMKEQIIASSDDPQPAPAYRSPIYCPQSCPVGLSNCCVQLAFHQHVHHILPVELDKDTSKIYQKYPYLSLIEQAFAGYNTSLTSAFISNDQGKEISHQAWSFGDDELQSRQSSDGSSASPPLTNPDQRSYQLFERNVQFSKGPYEQLEDAQSLLQKQPPKLFIVPSDQIPIYQPINPSLHKKIYSPEEQHSLPSSGDRIVPNWQHPTLGFVTQYQQKYENPKSVAELSSNTKLVELKSPSQGGKLDPNLVHYYMLQDAQATLNKTSDSDVVLHPQPFRSGSEFSKKNPLGHSTEMKGYVLLKHGPSGQVQNSFDDSEQPSKDSVSYTNLEAESFPRPHNYRTSNPSRDNHKKWMGKAMTNPLHDVKIRPRPEGSEGPQSFSSTVVPLPEDPSLSAEQVETESPKPMKNHWKAIPGSRRNIRPHIPEKLFQKVTSATNHQTDGLTQSSKEADRRK